MNAMENTVNNELKIESSKPDSFLQSATHGVGEVWDVGKEVVGDWVTEGKKAVDVVKSKTEEINEKPPYIKGVSNALVFWGGAALVAWAAYRLFLK